MWPGIKPAFGRGKLNGIYFDASFFYQPILQLPPTLVSLAGVIEGNKKSGLTLARFAQFSGSLLNQRLLGRLDRDFLGGAFLGLRQIDL